MRNMSADTETPKIPAASESDIRNLARETDMPLATVQKIYAAEHAKLDRRAKIKTFIPTLLRRRVKEILQSQFSVHNVSP
jgi:hypothetical protein